jgi:hypothetical protein
VFSQDISVSDSRSLCRVEGFNFTRCKGLEIYGLPLVARLPSFDQLRVANNVTFSALEGLREVPRLERLSQVQGPLSLVYPPRVVGHHSRALPRVDQCLRAVANRIMRPFGFC